MSKFDGGGQAFPHDMVTRIPKFLIERDEDADEKLSRRELLREVKFVDEPGRARGMSVADFVAARVFTTLIERGHSRIDAARLAFDAADAFVKVREERYDEKG